SEKLVARRLAVSSEVMRLEAAGDTAALAALRARAEGRAVMETVNTNFDRLAAEEQRLLAIRRADSQRTGAILPGIDLARAPLRPNEAAKPLRHYRPGMTIADLRAQGRPRRADGSALPVNEMPSMRVLRGEQFAGEEITGILPGRRDPVHLVVSGRPLRDGF